MRRDVSATPHFSTARRDIASMETFQLDSLIAEGAPEVVLLRERRDSESKPDTFVDDIKYLLARERLVNRESEGKDDDSDDGGADAKDGAASAAAAKDTDVPEAKGDAVFLESDDDADAKDGAPDTVYLESDDAKDGARDTVFLESDADDDDAKSGASSDAESTRPRATRPRRPERDARASASTRSEATRPSSSVEYAPRVRRLTTLRAARRNATTTESGLGEGDPSVAR